MTNFFKFYKKYFFDFHHDFNKQYQKSISLLPDLCNTIGQLYLNLSLSREIDHAMNGTGESENTKIIRNIKKELKKSLNAVIAPYLMALTLLYGLNYIISINTMILIVKLGDCIPLYHASTNVGLCYFYVFKDMFEQGIKNKKKDKKDDDQALNNIIPQLLKKVIFNYAKLFFNGILGWILPAKLYTSIVNFSNFISTLNKPVHFLWVGFLFGVELLKTLFNSFKKEGKEYFARDVLFILREKVKLHIDPKHNNQESTLEELFGFINDSESKQIILSIINSYGVEQEGENEVTTYIRDRINVAK